MTRQLAYGMLAFLASACASGPASTAPTPANAAPTGLIYATYTGGMLNRQTEAVFKVDESSYVMVAHLGGDGRVTVLYPEDARESGRVQGGKWFRTNHVAAYYDAAPQLYSFATNTFRSVGAQLDSYDGRGYGFVFLIASKRPLRFDRISEFGLWNDLELTDYRAMADPRIFINSLAQVLAGDHAYTLKFARSTSTVAITSYSDMLFDCVLLSQYAFTSYLAPFGYSNFYSSQTIGLPGNRGGCGASTYRYAYRPVTFTTATPAFGPTTPTTPTTPRSNPLPRPPRRTFGDPRSALSFSNPMRRNSPENPAAAPRDWSYRAWPTFGERSRSTFGQPTRGGYESPRSNPAPGSSGSFTRSAPMSAPDHRVVIERAAPASQPTTTTQTQSKPKGDQNRQ